VHRLARRGGVFGVYLIKPLDKINICLFIFKVEEPLPAFPKGRSF
jgi:hypothetical protein